MMRYLLSALLLATLALPASAARRPDVIACSAAAISAGLCESGDSLLVIPIRGPSGSVDATALEYALAHNWQATVPCEQEQVVDGRVLVVAGVTQGSCSAGQLNTTIANPQTARSFAAAIAQRELTQHVLRHRRQLAEAGVVVDDTDPSE